MDPKVVELIKQLGFNQDAAETSAPKRDTCSWKPKPGNKKGPKKSGIPKTSVGNPVVNPNPPGKVPPGQYLSKVSTELSNDPLSVPAGRIQFLLEEGYDLREVLTIDKVARESKNDKFAHFRKTVNQVILCSS